MSNITQTHTPLRMICLARMIWVASRYVGWAEIRWHGKKSCNWSPKEDGPVITFMASLVGQKGWGLLHKPLLSLPKASFPFLQHRVQASPEQQSFSWTTFRFRFRANQQVSKEAPPEKQILHGGGIWLGLRRVWRGRSGRPKVLD